MYYQNESFGMMDSGYFVPRGEIINWINNLLHLNITKIETLGSGNIYCQILDVIFPGKVPLNKVNWKAKLDYEFINNLKVLQSTFDKLGIKKHIEVEKISKAKYQDNLELIQWFKRYYDINCGGRGDNYSAQEKRNYVQPDFSFSQKQPPGSKNGHSKNTPVVSHPLTRPKKLSSPNLGLQSRQTNTPKQTIKQAPSRTTYKPPQIIHHEQQQLIRQKQFFTQQKPKKQVLIKSPHQQKLELISQILAKQDLSRDEKLSLIQQVMSL